MITGGARGIGLGIATALAGDGCDLIVNGMRSADDVADVLTALRALSARVVYAQGDVSDAAARARMLELAHDEFGRLDVLVNNAGITSVGRKDLLEADEASWDRVFDVNLKGPFFLTQQVAAWMIAQREADSGFAGTIINISSISAQIVSTNRGDYCLTKAAIGMATKLWAARLADHGVAVYEIQPGVIESDMTVGVKEKYDRLFAEGLALERRWGKPQDVGRAAAMLVRGDLPYATGQTLEIAGGMMIRQM